MQIRRTMAAAGAAVSHNPDVRRPRTRKGNGGGWEASDATFSRYPEGAKHADHLTVRDPAHPGRTGAS